jgi:hypothetical protein
MTDNTHPQITFEEFLQGQGILPAELAPFKEMLAKLEALMQQDRDAQKTPDTQSPHVYVPGTQAKEPQAPDTQSPHVYVPGTQAKETQAPDTQTPETDRNTAPMPALPGEHKKGEKTIIITAPKPAEDFLREQGLTSKEIAPFKEMLAKLEMLILGKQEERMQQSPQPPENTPNRTTPPNTGQTDEPPVPPAQEAPTQDMLEINNTVYRRGTAMVGGQEITVISMEKSTTDPQTGITTTQSASISGNKQELDATWSKLEEIDRLENKGAITDPQKRQMLDDALPRDLTTDAFIYGDKHSPERTSPSLTDKEIMDIMRRAQEKQQGIVAPLGPARPEDTYTIVPLTQKEKDFSKLIEGVKLASTEIAGGIDVLATTGLQGGGAGQRGSKGRE